MKNKTVMLCLVVAIAAVSCAAADVNWQPRNVTFSEAVIVGGTPLPAGDYKVEHVMKGDEHVMVFTNVDNKKLRAESKCHMVQSPEKQKRAEQAYVTENGKSTLKRLIFKGDVYVHELY